MDSSAASDSADQCLYYVGIGSMMNPTSLAMRNLHPLQSWPCKCIGFVRRFWGRMGMAEIFEEEGGEFHAVLHKMSDADMKALDEMERGYIRKDVTCCLYDGTRIIATGYQFDRSKLSVDAARPPSERYVDIMVAGMEHFGCDKDAIRELRNTPDQVPRRDPSEYIRIEVPSACCDKQFTWDEVNRGDGKEGRPLLVVFNGCVLRFNEAPTLSNGTPVAPEKFAERRAREASNAGKDITHIPNRLMYEPKFPHCSCRAEMTEAHIAYAEDLFWRNNLAAPTYWSCVGRVEYDCAQQGQEQAQGDAATAAV